MSADLSRRVVQAVDELAGVAEVIGLKFGEPAKVAVVQLQRAVGELIEAADQVNALSIQSDAHRRLRAAVDRVKGGAA